jgi:hypothetical protein
MQEVELVAEVKILYYEEYRHVGKPSLTSEGLPFINCSMTSLPEAALAHNQ